MLVNHCVTGSKSSSEGRGSLGASRYASHPFPPPRVDYLTPPHTYMGCCMYSMGYGGLGDREFGWFEAGIGLRGVDLGGTHTWTTHILLLQGPQHKAKHQLQWHCNADCTKGGGPTKGGARGGGTPMGTPPLPHPTMPCTPCPCAKGGMGGGSRGHCSGGLG